MRLSEAETRTVARKAGISEKAVFRLTGSVRIALPQKRVGQTGEAPQDPPSRKELDIGLRLQSAEVLAPVTVAFGREAIVARVSDALHQYFSVCPNVCAWIARGDYRADKVPELITRAMLVHACRTAGRLRAAVLRC